MFRVQTIRVIALHLRARSSLAVANAGTNRDKNLRAAERDARRIERERLPWANALAHLVRAALQSTRNKTTEALAHLDAAIAVFKTHDMALWEVVATRRKGELLGGDEGHALISNADGWMKGQSIANPERITTAFASGFAPTGPAERG